MTGQDGSYSAMLRRVAKRHEFEVQNFETLTVTGEILVSDAAALRQLAGRMEQLGKLMPPTPPGFQWTEAAMREYITPAAALDFAVFCAAGFPNTRTESKDNG